MKCPHMADCKKPTAHTICEMNVMPPDGPKGRKGIEGGAQRVLTAHEGYGVQLEGGYSAYNPLELPALHRYFQALGDDETKMLTFADKYGMLGEPVDVGATGDRGVVEAVEPLRKWLDAVSALSTAITVFDTQKSRPMCLSRWFSWKTEGDYTSVLFQTPTMRSQVADNTRHRTGLFNQLKRGDLQMPARVFVQDQINRALRGLVLPMLLFDEKMELRLHDVPHSLYAAIWLQFAREVNGSVELGHCANDGCNEWWEIKGRGKSRKKFCTPRCKQADFERKKAQR